MAYMCIRSNKECDGCGACLPKPRCIRCDVLLDECDIEENDGYCYVCREDQEYGEEDYEDE